MNTLPHLYELSAEYRQLAETLADGDFDAQTVADTIEASGIKDDMAVKATGCEMIARAAEAHTGAIEAEIERLQKLKKRRQNIAKGLRDYVLHNMQSAGITKLESPLLTLSIRNNNPAVDVLDADQIPASFMRYPEAPPAEPDKPRILAALKAGEDIPGVKLKQTQRLVIA